MIISRRSDRKARKPRVELGNLPTLLKEERAVCHLAPNWILVLTILV